VLLLPWPRFDRYCSLFAGLSVTCAPPFGTPQDVRDEVDYFLDFSDGGRGLFLFTSNVTGYEVPPENIRTAYRYIKTLRPHQCNAGALSPWQHG
jgi:hypothetical protein